MESMMSARQVAELLGVHENWVYDQAVGGDLPSYKIGGTRRFDPDEVRGWIAEHRQSDGGCKPRRRSARRPTVAATTQSGAQHRDGQSETTRVKRNREEGAARLDNEWQPRLFEG
jgi:excisionase family DNA binding protein